MSTISFHLLLKASRFSNTYYNNDYLRHLPSLNLFLLQERKKQPYIKIPTQHYAAGRSLQQKMTIFLLEIYKGVSRIYLNGDVFIKYGDRRSTYSKGLLFEWKRKFEGLRCSLNQILAKHDEKRYLSQFLSEMFDSLQ